MNSKDKDNITALMEASIMDHRDVVKHLLKVKGEACAVALRASRWLRVMTVPFATIVTSHIAGQPALLWLRISE